MESKFDQQLDIFSSPKLYQLIRPYTEKPVSVKQQLGVNTQKEKWDHWKNILSLFEILLKLRPKICYHLEIYQVEFKMLSQNYLRNTKDENCLATQCVWLSVTLQWIHSTSSMSTWKYPQIMQLMRGSLSLPSSELEVPRYSRDLQIRMEFLKLFITL